MISIRRFLISTFAAAAIAASMGASEAAAQLTGIRFPRASPMASVMQRIGVTDVTIVYGRPAVKGRTIWGEWPKDAKGESTLDNQNERPAGAPIVPYGHIWRTGANEATQFTVTDDVLINGQKLAAGSYSLHTIPGKDEWTVVFNGTANQWGSFNYDPAKDTLRVKTKPQWVAESQEYLAFSIDPASDSSAVVTIRWEKVRVPFTVEVADVKATTIARAREAIAAAKADDWRTPYQAAIYARDNKMDAEAKAWFEQALKVADANLAAKETFQNYVAKTNILLASGRRDEAFAVAEKAIARGKADKVDTAAFEKRIADLKAQKN
ncbi:MAG: DUF2911 domain-containing protein [Pyrinomonadaceae bacterium]